MRPAARGILPVALGLLGLLGLLGGLGACRAPVPSVPSALEGPSLDALRVRAERARGLRFLAPVEARAIAPGEVAPLLWSELDAVAPPETRARTEALQGALGLLPPGVDLGAAVVEFQAQAVAGFYTPLRNRLYVVVDEADAAPSPGADPVIVHELVHALQAQHTRLLDVALGLDDEDDLVFALGALLEGDALRASFLDQQRTAAILPTPAEAYAREFALEWEGVDASVPRALRDTFLLQYPLGYALVEVLAGEGGQGAIDRALADPPLSSEEVLHPELYLDPARRRPRPALEVAAAALGEGCAELAAGSYGELGVRVWARERGADPERAAALAAGWDGDRAVQARCAAGDATVWLLQFDTVADAVALAGFARERAVGPGAAGPGLDVARAGRRVVLSRGAPSVDAVLAAPVTRFASLDAFLAARPDVLARAEARRRAAR